MRIFRPQKTQSSAQLDPNAADKFPQRAKADINILIINRIP